jgi:hypothetical protein
MSAGVEVAIGAAVLIGIAGASWGVPALGAARREAAELRSIERTRRAAAAAREAAEEQPAFAPQAIARAVREIAATGTGMWHGAASPAGLERRPDRQLIQLWARSRTTWLGASIAAHGEPAVQLLDVVNRGSEEEDRVVVRVRIRVRRPHTRRDPVGELMVRHRITLDERWTLRRAGAGWLLVDAEGDPLAGPVLRAPLIATPADDVERLRAQSLAELATEDVTAHPDVSGLVAPGTPPATALLDLSNVDERFLPALIADAISQLVEAWGEACAGAEGRLRTLASEAACDALLHPRPGTRMILRDAALRSWQATEIRPDGRVEVSVTLDAYRYLASASTGATSAGNPDSRHTIAVTWLLELRDSRGEPWQLAESSDPAAEIPG